MWTRLTVIGKRNDGTEALGLLLGQASATVPMEFSVQRSAKSLRNPDETLTIVANDSGYWIREAFLRRIRTGHKAPCPLPARTRPASLAEGVHGARLSFGAAQKPSPLPPENSPIELRLWQ
jgi:hypothetical protein